MEVRSFVPAGSLFWLLLSISAKIVRCTVCDNLGNWCYFEIIRNIQVVLARFINVS